MSVLVSDILLSSLLLWTDSLENERRRKPQPLFAVNRLRKVGERSAQRRLRAGISGLDCCVSVSSFRDDWSDRLMIYTDQVLTASVPGNRRCGSGGTGLWG